MIYNNLLARNSYLERQINRITIKLNELPQGKLISCTNHGSQKWFVRQDSKTTYLPKSERALAEQLAARRYLELLLKEYTQEKRCLVGYLHCLNNEKLSKQLLENSRYQPLLTPFFRTEDDYVSCWMNEPYQGNPAHPENLVHETPYGYMVRSKSEQLISQALFNRGIPHRYECPLLLNTTTVYPDFTLMHPQTHKLYYYEHFGMMDDPEYAAEAGRKIQRYIACGIIPSINLIITSETRLLPLNPSDIEQQLSLYF